MILFDTIIAAHLLDESSGVSLRDVAGLELGVENWGKGVQNFGEKMGPKSKPPTSLWGAEGMGAYAARDAGYTHLVYELQRDKIKADPQLARLMKFLILPGLEAYTQLELNGMWVDLDRLQTRRKEIEERKLVLFDEMLKFVPEEFKKTADFDKTGFLQRWLYGLPPDGLGIEARFFTEKTKQPQVTEEALMHSDHPAVALLFEWRGNNKKLGFFDQWEEYLGEGQRIYSYFNFTGTVTGRRSGSNPNMMQIPREKAMRSILGAPPGYFFFEVDYAQIEVRLMAWLCGDESLTKIFFSEEDPYTLITSLLLGIPLDKVTKQERQQGKAIVLGFLYGMGAAKFGRYALSTFGVTVTAEEAVLFRDRFFNLFPGVLKFHKKQAALVRKNLLVRSPMGRIRHLMNILSYDSYERWKAEAQSINSPIQGTGGDLNLASMVQIHSLGLPSDEVKAIGDVHDSLLFQLREDVWQKHAMQIMEIMEEQPLIRDKFGVKVPIPLKVTGKISTHWGEADDEFSIEDLRQGNVPSPVRGIQ